MCIFKVTGYTFRGSNSVIFIFASLKLLNRGVLLKKRICSCRSKFFPLRVDPFSEVLFRSGKQRRTHSCCPWIKMAEKHGRVSIYLNYSEFLFACIKNQRKFLSSKWLGLLAWLFSKKTVRYCHCPGVASAVESAASSSASCENFDIFVCYF